MKTGWIGVALAAWLLGPGQGVGWAQVRSAQPRILKVQKLDNSDERVEGRPDLSGWRAVKFFNDTELPVGKEVFEVDWAPPSNGMEAGAVLLFEYRRENDRMIKSKFVQYPFAVYKTRKATFVLPPANAYEDGQIVMWRARLIRKGRMLTELASDTWR